MPLKFNAESLRKRRAVAAIPLSALADALGVAPSTIWHWERGNTTPDDDHVRALAKALGCTVAELAREPELR